MYKENMKLFNGDSCYPVYNYAFAIINKKLCK